VKELKTLKINRSEQLQFVPSTEKFVQIQTTSNQFKLLQTSSNQFKLLQTTSNQLKPVQTTLKRFLGGEAHFADSDGELFALLPCSHDTDISDGQFVEVLGVVVEDCLMPLTIVQVTFVLYH